jgi:hypothetical protein
MNPLHPQGGDKGLITKCKPHQIITNRLPYCRLAQAYFFNSNLEESSECKQRLIALLSAY